MDNFKKLVWQSMIAEKTDFNGLFLEASDAFCHVTQYSREEIIGKTHHILNSNFHSEEFWKKLWSTIQSGNIWQGEIRNQAKDGSYFWLDSVIYPIIIDDRVDHFITISSEITHRKNSEFELEQQVNLQKLLFRYAPVGFMRMDTQGQCMNINKKWIELSGQSLRQVIGTGWMDSIIAEDQPRVRKSMENMVKNNQRFQEVFRFHRKENIVWVIGTANRFDDKEGRPLEYLLSLVDITEIKKAEKEIEQERTRSMRLSKMSALVEMAGGIAHEINNPLAIISGRSAQIKRLLSRDMLDKQRVDEQLESINLTVRRIANIVKGLRIFSHTGEAEPADVFSLNQVIEETLALVRQKIQTDDIELKWNPGVDIRVWAKSVQISQLLLNLLNNAREAAVGNGDQKRWIEIRVCEKESNIHLEILDSGKGIPSKDVDRVWEPFFSTKNVGDGHGMGLSIALGLAKENGGDLRYDPIDGMTRFVLSIPKVQIKKQAA